MIVCDKTKSSKNAQIWKRITYAYVMRFVDMEFAFRDAKKRGKKMGIFLLQFKRHQREMRKNFFQNGENEVDYISQN